MHDVVWFQSYVSCTLGVANVGYIFICYGVVDATCSFLFGRLVEYVGHVPFFVLGESSTSVRLCARLLKRTSVRYLAKQLS